MVKKKSPKQLPLSQDSAKAKEEKLASGIDYLNRFCQLCGICIGKDFDSDAYIEPNGEFKVCLSCFKYLKKSDLYVIHPGLGKEGKVRSTKRKPKDIEIIAKKP